MPPSFTCIAEVATSEPSARLSLLAGAHPSPQPGATRARLLPHHPLRASCWQVGTAGLVHSVGLGFFPGSAFLSRRIAPHAFFNKIHQLRTSRAVITGLRSKPDVPWQPGRGWPCTPALSITQPIYRAFILTEQIGDPASSVARCRCVVPASLEVPAQPVPSCPAQPKHLRMRVATMQSWCCCWALCTALHLKAAPSAGSQSKLGSLAAGVRLAGVCGGMAQVQEGARGGKGCREL